MHGYKVEGRISRGFSSVWGGWGYGNGMRVGQWDEGRAMG